VDRSAKRGYSATAKIEAWVVLELGPQSCIYAGLKTGTTAAGRRLALKSGTVMDHLAEFTPKPGNGIFLRAETVHTLGGDIVVFEIQKNSDVTFQKKNPQSTREG
jgi:mannose-6-phosphate isomerase